MANNMTHEINNDVKSWEDLNIKPSLLRGIYGYGFEDPSPIQKKSNWSNDYKKRHYSASTIRYW